MLNNKTVAIVIPAYNEETQIAKVIETIPDFIDRIVIVNDCSSDNTAAIVKTCINSANNKGAIVIEEKKEVKRTKYNGADIMLFEQNIKNDKSFAPSEVINTNQDSDRIILINHLKNSGVGAAIASGYNWCKKREIDCVAKMDGDGQMDPDELLGLCEPVVYEGVDYVKGNRLSHQSSFDYMPKVRFLGNSVLSILTKIASGYWRISDTQTGFTAISKLAINSIKLHEIYPGYGYPNDLLVKLNITNSTIREITIKPIYRIGEQSKMKIGRVINKVSRLLLKSFFKRIWMKYLIKDFHPLFILYHISFVLFFSCIPFAMKIVKYLTGEHTGDKPVLNSLVFMFLFFNSFQSLLFAMWMDIQDNERLNK